MRTLQSVADQEIPADCELRLIVADNDEQALLADDLAAFERQTGVTLSYVHAPARNISVARNACLDAADGTYLVFIDDDEIAEPGWIANLLATARQTGAGAVFGPARALYPPAAPEWMVENDAHSHIPVANRGVVETGYTSNVLLDRRDAMVRSSRFNTIYGRTGGEDCDFFLRLHRHGVRLAIEMSAVVSEPVSPGRMTTGWVLRRRFWSGRVYGHCSVTAVTPSGAAQRTGLMARSVAKSLFCGMRALLATSRTSRRLFWAMRGSFHVGVAVGAMSRPQAALYGGE